MLFIYTDAQFTFNKYELHKNGYVHWMFELKFKGFIIC